MTVYGTDGATVLGSASGSFAVGHSGSFALSSFAGAQLLAATIANASGSTSVSLGAFVGGAKVYACDDFGAYGTAAIGGQAPGLVGFSASDAWAQPWPTAVRGQADDLSFPDFVLATNRTGSIYRRGSDGYSDSAKRALAADAIPYAGTFYYRFVFRQSSPETDGAWGTRPYHTGCSLGLSTSAATRQGVGDIWLYDKQIAAGPMQYEDGSTCIRLRTGWGAWTELVSTNDYAYATDWLVCVETTLSDVGVETFRAFAQKVSDCTRRNLRHPAWVDCTECATDIASSAAPFTHLVAITQCAAGNTGSIAFDEFRLGATLDDVFPTIPNATLIVVR